MPDTTDVTLTASAHAPSSTHTPQTAAGVSAAVAAALRADVDTPAYVYDLGEVRANAIRLRAALPEPSEVYYSLKANPHPAVVDALRGAGALPEVSSPGELDAALAAGWPPDQVLYTGPGKRDQDVSAALRSGVQEFCVDSPVGLDQLDRLASEAGVAVRTLLRVNDDHLAAGNGLAMTGVPSQFGADFRWILDEPERFADRRHARVTGLHLYMGSNLTSVGDLLAQFAQSLATATELAEVLARYVAGIEVLNLGGGFGAPFATEGGPLDLSTLRPRLVELLDERVPGWREGRPRIAFESGRYLVGTAGTLLTRVLDVKRSHGKEVAVLESGINHLGGMAGLRRLPPLNPKLSVADERPRDEAGGGRRAETTAPTLVTGPLCTPLDTWSRGAPLPPLRPGDLLTVPNVGAYGLYASLLAFLCHPAPTELAVDRGRPVHVSRLHLIRKD